MIEGSSQLEAKSNARIKKNLFMVLSFIFFGLVGVLCM
jgi:hypothetical protein